MKIYNTDTKTIEELIHGYYDTDVAKYIVGNTGGYKYNDDHEATEMSQDDLNWWNKYFDADEKFMNEKDDLQDIKVYDYLSDEGRELIEKDIQEAITNLGEMTEEPIEGLKAVKSWENELKEVETLIDENPSWDEIINEPMTLQSIKLKLLNAKCENLRKNIRKMISEEIDEAINEGRM